MTQLLYFIHSIQGTSFCLFLSRGISEIFDNFKGMKIPVTIFKNFFEQNL